MSLEKENKNYIKDSHILTGETLQAESESNKNVTKASEILGYELVSMLKISKDDLDDSEVPLWVEQNVLKAYKKDYRYRIIWRTIKMKAIEYKEVLFANGRGLEIALAATITLFILSGIIYYQYTKSQTDITKATASKQTPKIEGTPVTNNTNISDKAEISKDESNVSKVQDENKLTKEKDNLAVNLVKPNLGNLRASRPSSNIINKKIQLESIKNIYLGNLISVQENREWILKFCEELKIGTESHLDWKAEEQPQGANNAEATFKLENSKLVLKDRQHKILWVSKFKLDPTTTEPKDIASKIVNELSEKIKSKPKSNFVNRSDSLK